MVERWTRERRIEHTRALLLDAAEEVFAEKGFTPATLDDIAHAAGYTKGAIYKHFATKEELFLAVSDRYWRRYFDNFAEVMSSARQIGARELDEIAKRWRQLSCDRGAEHAALGHEFTLYLLRNPDARDRVAAKRSEVVEALGKFIVEGIDRMGGTLSIPPLTFAQVLIATSDAVVLGSQLDDVDLYRPIVEMYVSAIKLP
jgi:AcrR family transcriptional regulator